MKTSRLVSAVVAGHCLVVGAILCVQGCGTTGPVTSSTPPPEPPMPGAVVARPTPPVSTATHRPALPPIVKPPVKSWPTETTAYTVQKGDSISLICSRFHVSRAEVMALNRITDANKIKAGQELQLPGKVNLGAPMPVTKKKAPAAAPEAKETTASTPATSAASVAGVYEVKGGDSLSKIASRNGTTVAALKEANGLKSDRINVGQKLKLTGAASAAADPVADVPVAADPVAADPAAATLTPPPAVEMDADTGAVVSEVPAPPPAPVATSFRTHVVEPGEDLYHVMLMWDVSVEELQRINGLGTNTTLSAGQSLQIPIAQ